MIKPTVGRVVWFYPGEGDGLHHFRRSHGADPMAAHVAHVWHDRMVNLMVINPNGHCDVRTSVSLRQDGDPEPQGSYCEWMPDVSHP
jgi:hypothetical protein